MSEEIKQEEKKSGAGLWIIIALIGLIGAGVMGWLYSKEHKKAEEYAGQIKNMQGEMSSMDEALSGYIEGSSEDLKANFQEMLATYDALIEKDETQADSLNLQKAEIEKLLAELSDTKKRSYSQINRLKKENGELRGIMYGYLKQIDSLNTMNLDLTNRLDRTTSDLNLAVEERNTFKEDAEKNADLVKKGARLNAYSFNSYAFRYKANGSPSETNRARRADGIQSEFTIGENKISKTGNKAIYMQVVDPNGQVLYSRSNNTTEVDGKSVIYTDKREISYQGQSIDVAVVYNLQGKDIAKGNYSVKIFADGALIGKDSFTLK